jgi:hypothetical protein
MREHVAWSGPGFQILVREDDVAAANEALIPVGDPNFKDDDPERFLASSPEHFLTRDLAYAFPLLELFTASVPRADIASARIPVLASYNASVRGDGEFEASHSGR